LSGFHGEIRLVNSDGKLRFFMNALLRPSIPEHWQRPLRVVTEDFRQLLDLDDGHFSPPQLFFSTAPVYGQPPAWVNNKKRLYITYSFNFTYLLFHILWIAHKYGPAGFFTFPYRCDFIKLELGPHVLRRAAMKEEFDGLTPEQQSSLQNSRERVIHSIGKNMDLYGISLSIGHLYGYMYFRNSPITLDEMSETMGMSKTSMSTGMRTLMDLKMINKVWGKGSRKDFYEVVPDWHQNFSDYFSVKWRKAVESNMAALRKSLQEIKALRESDGDNEQLQWITSRDEEKITEALKYYRWLVRLIDALETGEIYQYIPKEE
jgi:DNA-binding transcriptional regulator GbsR (MarR family)